MSTLLVVRTGADATDGSQIAAYFKEASRRAATTHGFQAGRLYRNTEDSGENMILWLYRDIPAAEEGLRAVANGPALPQFQTVAAPADVRRTKVLRTYATSKDGLLDGDYLSMSVRIAEPGFGHELAAELERIFGELSVIPGLSGTIIATNDTLDEEIVGLCSWRDVESFRMSLPEGVFYDVRLFRRVA